MTLLVLSHFTLKLPVQNVEFTSWCLQTLSPASLCQVMAVHGNGSKDFSKAMAKTDTTLDCLDLGKALYAHRNSCKLVQNKIQLKKYPHSYFNMSSEYSLFPSQTMLCRAGCPPCPHPSSSLALYISSNPPPPPHTHTQTYTHTTTPWCQVQIIFRLWGLKQQCTCLPVESSHARSNLKPLVLNDVSFCH